MTDHVLLSKFLVGLLCLASYFVLLSSRRIANSTDRQFRLLLALLWVITRLGLYGVAFLLLNMSVTSDVSGFYYPEGLQARLGHVVYHDFATSYAPAFPYLTAFIISIWNSPKAICLASILFDGAGLILWLRACRRLFDPSELRRISIFYVMSSAVILNVAIAGQNQVWISFFLAAALLAYENRRAALAAVLLGLPIVLVKFIPIVFLPAFLRLSVSRSIRFVAACLAIPLVVVVALLVQGIDALQPLRLQGGLVTPGNLPYLLSAFVRLHESPANWLIPGVTALTLIFVALRLFNLPGELSGRQVVFSLSIILLTVALFSRKFFPTYLMLAFVPLCAVAAADGGTLLAALRFGLFNLAAALEPSLWFRLLHASEEHGELWVVMPPLLQSGQGWKLWVFLSVDFVLLSFYAYYLVKAWGLVRHALNHRDACRS